VCKPCDGVGQFIRSWIYATD